MDDEEEVRELLRRYKNAVHARNATALIACYAPDIVAYDLAPPLAIGPDAMHDPSGVQQWFDTWQGPVESDVHALVIRRSGDLACAYSLRHMSGRKVGETGDVDLWFRATTLMERRDGHWLITHEHNSVPFAMDGSEKALLNLKPEG